MVLFKNRSVTIILFFCFLAIHGHHAQNIQNESLMAAQAAVAVQHNSHLVSRQSPHVVHSVNVGQNQGSRIQVCKQQSCTPIFII